MNERMMDSGRLQPDVTTMYVYYRVVTFVATVMCRRPAAWGPSHVEDLTRVPSGCSKTIDGNG